MHIVFFNVLEMYSCHLDCTNEVYEVAKRAQSPAFSAIHGGRTLGRTIRISSFAQKIYAHVETFSDAWCDAFVLREGEKRRVATRQDEVRERGEKRRARLTSSAEIDHALSCKKRACLVLRAEVNRIVNPCCPTEA